MKKPKGGYVAISRSIFEHPLFQSARRFTWREAWEWLIMAAAWQAEGQRNKHGIFELRRAQLALTCRELATAWRWPKSTVHHYLRRLEREGMIGIEKSYCWTKNGAENKTKSGYERLCLTICKYDEFQAPARTIVGHKAGHKAGRNVGQELLPLAELADEIVPPTRQPSESSEFKKEAPDRVVNRSKPFHGARSRKGAITLRWWDHGTWEWNEYAEDYKTVRGVAIFPATYLDGRGNWFAEMGEAARLAKSRKSG